MVGVAVDRTDRRDDLPALGYLSGLKVSGHISL